MIYSQAINIPIELSFPYIRHSPGKRIDEESDDNHCDDDTREINRWDLIDFRFRWSFQVLVASVAKDAEIRAAQFDFVPAVSCEDGGVVATSGIIVPAIG